MTGLYTIILGAFLMTDCGNTKTENNNQLPMTQKQIDTSVIAVLPFEASNNGIFKNCKPTQLTAKDLSSIENLLTDCINKYNLDQEKKFNEINIEYRDKFDKNNFVIDLKRYKRQYVAFINEKGEKEVCINCFCRDGNKDWRKEIIMVMDGGNCYFNLKINLTAKKHYDLRVNGEA